MPSRKSEECRSRNDENERHDGQNPENKECFNLPPLLLFLFYAIKEFLDCLFDWLLLYEINLLDEGLLAGPVTNIIWNCLFVFSCIGTIVSGIDILNRFRKLRNGLTVSENSITEIGVMFLEDIPQLVIAVSILYCRREKSIWTVIKAAILMVTSCIAFKRMYKELKPVICKLVLITKNVLAVGHIAVAFFSAVTLLISLASWSFEITDNETWRNLTVGERIQKEYPKYFSNVSIYADEDDFQVPGHDLRSKAWIKFVEINYILKHGEIKTEITSDLHYLKIRTFFDGDGTNICYHLNTTSSDISPRRTTNCALFNGTTFHFYFKYMPPNSRYHFGDIEFNVRKTPMDSCNDLSLKRTPNVRYFRSNVPVDKSEHLRGPLADNPNEFKFFSEDSKDLVEIKKYWRLVIAEGEKEGAWGFDCFKLGSISPHLNSEILVPCPDANSAANNSVMTISSAMIMAIGFGFSIYNI